LRLQWKQTGFAVGASGRLAVLGDGFIKVVGQGEQLGDLGVPQAQFAGQADVGVEDQAGAADDVRLDVLEQLGECGEGALAATPAVADEGDGLALPLGLEEVDRVLQRGREEAVVLGGDDDERVDGVDRVLPGERVGLGVDAGPGGEVFEL